MPRFPVNFRRKSTVIEDQNAPVEPSFRVLERNDAGPGKSFDGGARMMKTMGGKPRTVATDLTAEDNIFADLKTNRGSGSSNTTKATSDNSSRHSNASTTPSSTDYAAQDDWRNSTRKNMNDPLPPPPKTSPGGFLRQAGRTFSFGNAKKNHHPLPAQEPLPALPNQSDNAPPGGRPRAPTASTVTEDAPQVESRDFMLDLGGDLSNMLSAFNKRTSVATVKDETGRPVLASRNLTGHRVSHPSPLHLDQSTVVEAPPKSWNSQRSNEALLESRKAMASPQGMSPTMSDDIPPPVPRHGPVSPPVRQKSPDEQVGLLQDSLTATKFLSSANESTSAANGASRGYRRSEDTISSLKESYARPSRVEAKEEDNLFDTSYTRSRYVSKINRVNNQPKNKVMTPDEFEKYRQDKMRQSASSPTKDESDNDDDEEEEEEDDREKAKELAKQRKKQEAHMTVYRQQMMKVTGDQLNNGPSRMSMSMSTPDLLLTDHTNTKVPSISPSPPSDASEDEEVPLAILAAHGFPNKNRPPTRLNNMSSNPNLRTSMQPSYVAGPGSASGDAPRNSGSLPAFARKLPQDPFLGAGLVNQPPREAFSLGGGMQNRAVPVGGLVGVIANEERSRAMRRGSPAVDHIKNNMPMPMGMPTGMGMTPNGFDPLTQIPPQMMYPQQQPVLTPGDQAQIQMTQQMQQFMQMQMQFMQMMAGQGQPTGQMPMGMPGMPGMPGTPSVDGRPISHMPSASTGSIPDMQRTSFLGDPMAMGGGVRSSAYMEPPRDNRTRTMSMVQPSSASWIQVPQPGGYTPSIRLQGDGYAPSIAPSERSNIGLPGRYRPVSSINPLGDGNSRTHTMSGALPTLSKLQVAGKTSPLSRDNNDDDDDDEQGWEAMKAQREKKKNSWRAKKSLGSDLGALIS